jgi:hypothetical protein
MRLRSAGLALLAAAMLIGCGSVSASLRNLRQDAGRICRHTNRAFEPLPALPTQGRAASYLSTGVARLGTQLARLRRLSAPHDVADVYSAALGVLGQELSVLRRKVTAIRRGQDPAVAVRALREQLTPLESQANNAWQALQIPSCLQ